MHENSCSSDLFFAFGNVPPFGSTPREIFFKELRGIILENEAKKMTDASSANFLLTTLRGEHLSFFSPSQLEFPVLPTPPSLCQPLQRAPCQRILLTEAY